MDELIKNLFIGRHYKTVALLRYGVVVMNIYCYYTQQQNTDITVNCCTVCFYFVHPVSDVISVSV